MYAYLREMHDFLGWRCGDAIMLAEANVGRDEVDEYFGDGDRMHMLFNFLLNQHLFLALARQRGGAALAGAGGRCRASRATGQWANFLRNHDEIDLGRLTGGARGGLRRLRAREEHAALRPRHPPAPGTRCWATTGAGIEMATA